MHDVGRDGADCESEPLRVNPFAAFGEAVHMDGDQIAGRGWPGCRTAGGTGNDGRRQIDGKQNGYPAILKATQFTYFGYEWGMDALRVVDGELDNKYSPTRTPITVR